MTNRRDILFAALGACLLVAFVGFLARSEQRLLESDLPPRTMCADKPAALDAATAWIVDHGGSVVAVAGTGSMAPFIRAAGAGEDPRATIVAFIATQPGAQFEAVREGSLCLYHPTFDAKGCYLHVAAKRDALGWIMTGLHNRTYENNARVTAANFVGIAAHIFTWNP